MDPWTWKHRAPHLVWLALGFAVLAWVDAPPQQITSMYAHPECPIDSMNVDYHLSGAITRVPEFHDCQRFIVQSRWLFGLWVNQRYDSLYALWVRAGLGDTRFPTEATTLVPICTNALTHQPEPCPGTPAGAPTATAIYTAVPVTLIFSYATSEYQPLGIMPGFNCLYLWDPAAWKAKMVPVATEDKCFANVNPTTVAGKSLQVTPTGPLDPAGVSAQDYPPVGRWDRDPKTHHYYVGLRCNKSPTIAEWCEIGESEFASSVKYSAPSAAVLQRRTIEIKGWYDQQNLAVPTGSSIRPSRIMGTAFPDPGLQGRTLTDYQNATWLPAVHTSVGYSFLFPESPAVYKNKLNLDAGGVSGSMTPVPAFNTTYLCAGAKDKCIPPAHQSEVNCVATEWWAMIVSSARSDTVYRCVQFTPHPGINMPGVVRWRWLAGDETHWVSCPDGCCKVQS